MRNQPRRVKRQDRYFAVVFDRPLPAVAAEEETRFFGFFGCLDFFALAFFESDAACFAAAAMRSAKLSEIQVA